MANNNHTEADDWVDVTDGHDDWQDVPMASAASASPAPAPTDAPEPSLRPKHPPTQGDAALLNLNQGMDKGWEDEALAAALAARDTARGVVHGASLSNVPENFSSSRRDYLDAVRGVIKKSRELYPKTAAAASTAGNLLTEGALAYGTGGASLSPVGQAAIGAVEGAGGDESGTLKGTAEAAGKQALTRGALGAAFKAAPVVTGIGTGLYSLGKAAFDHNAPEADRMEEGLGGGLSLAGGVAGGVSNARNTVANTAARESEAGMTEALKPRDAAVQEASTSAKQAKTDADFAREAAAIAQEKRAGKAASYGEAAKTARSDVTADVNSKYHRYLDRLDRAIGSKNKGVASAEATLQAVQEAEDALGRSQGGLLGNAYQRVYDAVDKFKNLSPEERSKLDPAIAAKAEEYSKRYPDLLNKIFSEESPEEMVAKRYAGEKEDLAARKSAAAAKAEAARAAPVEIPGPKSRLVSKEEAARIARERFQLDPESLGEGFDPNDRSTPVPLDRGATALRDLAKIEEFAKYPERDPSFRSTALSADRAAERSRRADVKASTAKETFGKAREEDTPEAVLKAGDAKLKEARESSVTSPWAYVKSKIPGAKSFQERAAAAKSPEARAAFYSRLEKAARTDRSLVKYVPVIQAQNNDEIAKAAAKDPRLGALLKGLTGATNGGR